MIEQVLLRQVDWNVEGNIAEIGVHYGKSFLMFANGVRDGETAIALDVFDDQDKNLDSSGRGNRAIFESNVATWAQGLDIKIVQASSLEHHPETARETFGDVRVFSIDGGHTAAITAHDLRLAEAAVVPDGVVILDDAINAHWLGVVTGLADYLAGSPGLVPFAYGANKLFLAPSAAVADKYREALRESLPDLLGKVDVEFFGTVVDVYVQGSARSRAAGRTARAAAAAEAKRKRRTANKIARLERELAEARELTTLRGMPRLARRKIRSAVRRARAVAHRS
ncbi:class I SAM-dependent methyltransferase [Nocardioides marmoriginsengisoli]|nr:class I SAM-dependent methyltransferase [Nocardioides marmoriginsengisoli]